MRAAVVLDDEQGKRLSVQDVPRPSLAANEVLVRVHAAGLNRADLAMNVGHFRGAGSALTAAVAGLEFAGEIVEAGPDVTGARIGQRVMAMGQGAFAEFTKIDSRLLIPIPDTMPWEQAACAPVALMTMHDAIVTKGKLRTGESLLIQGASTGVGIVGAQIAKLKGSRPVIGTTTSRAKFGRLAEFGVDVAIDSAGEPVAERVRAVTDTKGADVIVDMVGGPALAANVAAAAIKGRLVLVGRLGGGRGEIDLDAVALKRLTLYGVTFRTRTVDDIEAIIRAMTDDIWPAVTAGRIRIPIDATMPLSAAPDAFAHMRKNGHFGKIVLTV